MNDERFKLANQQYFDLVQSDKFGVSLNVVFMEHNSDGRNLFPIDDFVNENIKSDFIFVLTQHDFVCMDNVLAVMHAADKRRRRRQVDMQVGEIFCIRDDAKNNINGRVGRNKEKSVSSFVAHENFTVFEGYKPVKNIPKFTISDHVVQCREAGRDPLYFRPKHVEFLNGTKLKKTWVEVIYERRNTVAEYVQMERWIPFATKGLKIPSLFHLEKSLRHPPKLIHVPKRKCEDNTLPVFVKSAG